MKGLGAEKFGMSLETRETKLFWRDVPGFCRGFPEAHEKFEKKEACVPKSSVCPSKPGKPNFFLAGCPRILPGFPGVCSIFVPKITNFIHNP